jgi:hypothetical protein
MQLPDTPRTGASGPTDSRADPLVFLGLNCCDLVGRTGFEPVTSSVSGNSGAVSGVCHRRTESNYEPLTCERILGTSRWVWGRLTALAPTCGSRRLAAAIGDRAAAPSGSRSSSW